MTLYVFMAENACDLMDLVCACFLAPVRKCCAVVVFGMHLLRLPSTEIRPSI